MDLRWGWDGVWGLPGSPEACENVAKPLSFHVVKNLRLWFFKDMAGSISQREVSFDTINLIR